MSKAPIFVRFDSARVNGHEHIVARIAVGDREDVQVVDRRAVAVQVLRARTDHIEI